MNKNWMRLDNAALIFPAVRNNRWVNTFRLSAEMKEEIDPAILQQAVDELLPRFPSFYLRLRTGLFWYFLEAAKKTPRVKPEFAYPLTHMSVKEQRQCCFRVLYHEKRIAVEFFHVLTDGTGGLIYLKTLLARYTELKYGIRVPAEEGVADIREEPRDIELKDAFQRVSGKYPLSRREATAYRLKGRPDPNGAIHVITGVVETERLKAAAQAMNTTVNGFLAAVMMDTIIEIQTAHVREKARKPVKITVPINLRKLFDTETFRNFSLVLNIGVDPRLKDYSLKELCREYGNQLALEAVPEKMAARIAANVLPQWDIRMRLAPLFLKKLALKMVYNRVGERKGCINISNLGQVSLPEELAACVDRMELMIGVQYIYPNNCAVTSYQGKTYINIVRNILETELERRFFTRLVRLGIPVRIESGDDEEEES